MRKTEQRMPTSRKLPFVLDRAGGESFKSQLAEGLRQAIRSGFYSSGDTLPSLNAVAAELNVSEIVARSAYRILATEGLIVSRPRIGSVVKPPKTPIWRGHVLCVMTDYDFNVLAGGVIGELREILTRNGYLFSQVLVLLDGSGRPDCTALKVALSRPVDFIVLADGQPAIERILSSVGIPFAVAGGGSVRPRGCVGTIRFSVRKAIAALVRKCVRRRISDVALVGFRNASPVQSPLETALSDARIRVRRIRLPLCCGRERRAESAERFGAEFIGRSMSQRGFRFPDLYYVDDDWLARGMLSAFMSLGVHIPKDVRFVCSSNGGFRPQAYGSVAAIEFDPYGRGGEVAKRIFSWLTERRPFPVSALEATYVDGSTFP